MKNLIVYDQQRILTKRKIHRLVLELSRTLKFKLVGLEINFISSVEIHLLNKTYLNHDYSTDIITFNYSSEDEPIDGEIFISIDEARFNAKKFKVRFNEEIARLVIHGILHILGYDDQITSKKLIMKRLENKLLSNYKFILL